jgi:hypothetical protein
MGIYFSEGMNLHETVWSMHRHDKQSEGIADFAGRTVTTVRHEWSLCSDRVRFTELSTYDSGWSRSLKSERMEETIGRPSEEPTASGSDQENGDQV